MQQVTIEQAKINLTVLVEAALKGEEIVIEDNEKAVKLVPFQVTKPKPHFGSAKGLIHATDNFDESLPAYL